MIVTAHSDHKARLWDAQDKLLVMTLEGHTNEIYCAAYNPAQDMKGMIVTASADRSARVWDVSDLTWGTKQGG
jgi:WD40 repeat protein